MWSVHGVNHATPAQPLNAVSSLLADIASQQAERGRVYEQEGKYMYALREYREAITGLNKHFEPPSNHATGNPKAFLARGGAYVDVARAWSRMLGNNQKEIRQAADSAELDFNSAIRNSDSDSAGRDMIQKAMLGRGYAWLLRGELTRARKDFEDIKSPQTLGPLVTPNQVQVAITRIDSGLAPAPVPPKPGPGPEKLAAYMKLGLEIVKVAFPKYQGLAVAIGDVMAASRK